MKEVYVILWHSRSGTQILEIWDEHEIALDRLHKYEKEIEKIGLLQQTLNVLSYCRERVYIEKYIVKSKG